MLPSLGPPDDLVAARSRLRADHCQFDLDLASLEWRVHQKVFAGAINRLREFRASLESHLSTEEQMVFPRFLEHSPTEAPVIARLTMENQTMRRMLRDLSEAAEAKDSGRFQAAAADLRDVFATHSGLEEQVIERAIDCAVGYLAGSERAGPERAHAIATKI
jgi:hemerythrin-like domain-containing protein